MIPKIRNFHQPITPDSAIITPRHPLESSTPVAHQNTTGTAIKSGDSVLNVPAPPLPSLSAPKPQADASLTAQTSASGSGKATSEPAAAAKPSAPVQLSPASVPLPANIAELEQAVEVAAQTAVNAYARAIQVLKS